MRTLLFALALATSPLASAADFSSLVPLTDLGGGMYGGFYGGLYENASNIMAADHFAAGLAAASNIQPLDEEGQPSEHGQIAFLAVGFGETARIMRSFMAIAASDRRVEHDKLVLLNAARDDADYGFWAERPDGFPRYDVVNVDTLTPARVTPLQVQAAWVEIINDRAFAPLGVAYADAYRLKTFIAETLREMKRQYPSLQIAYLSSRVYGGYVTTNFNPEPFAYESGLSNRWVITDQMEQARMEHPEWHSDTRVGLVDYRRGIVPRVAWGPYLWANGTTPRADGLTWQRADFESDGETLSADGAVKEAKLLFDFLLREPTAKGWFLSGIELPGRQRAARR